MATSQYTELQQAVLTGAVHRTNFFNGRVLTAEDLKTEQTAAHDEHAGLGRAIGVGVVWGYEITPGEDPPQSGASAVSVLAIQPGFALNRLGESVALGARTQLHLVRSTPAAAAGNDFDRCTGGVATLTNTGVYILTVAPTTGYEGAASTVGLDDDGIGSPCASGYAVAAVCFGLTQVDLTGATGLAAEAAAKTTAVQALDQGSITADVSWFRSCLASYFLESDTGTWAADPFPVATGGADPPHYRVSPDPDPGPLEEMYRQGLLDPAAVPLALIYWSKAGLQFVDWWAVRRPVHTVPAAAAWAPLAGGRDAALGLARFLQLQQQLDWLPAAVKQSRSATQLFRYLPPAGFARTADFTGGVPTFLTGLHTGGPTKISAAQLGPLIRAALSAPPLDLANGAGAYRVQRYQVDNADYEVFATRALHGIRESDDVASIFNLTWNTYQSLADAFLDRLSYFLGPSSLPSGTVTAVQRDLDEARAIFLELFAINTLAQVATRSLVLAAGRDLDYARAVAALLELCQPQRRVGRVLLDEFAHLQFYNRATDLLAWVDTLQAECAAQDLAGAVTAQRRINALVVQLTQEIPGSLVRTPFTPGGTPSGGTSTGGGGTVGTTPTTGTVTGSVTVFGSPIVGLTIRVTGTALATTTDSRGKFQLTGVPAGQRSLEATVAFQTVRASVFVPAGGTATVTIDV